MAHGSGNTPWQDYPSISTPVSAERLNRIEDFADLQKSRIDAIAKLPSGSTTGDAELVDIRVGVDGSTYPTAGEAVREQARHSDNFSEYIRLMQGSALKYSVSHNIFDKSRCITGGYLSYLDGSLKESANFAYSDYEAVKGGTRYYLSFNYGIQVCFYDAGKRFLSGVLKANNVNYFDVPDDYRVAYYRCNCPVASLQTALVSEYEDDLLSYTAYNPMVFLPITDPYMTDGDMTANAKAVGDGLRDIIGRTEAVTTRNNLFDRSRCIRGGFYRYTDGVWRANVSYGSTDYIQVVQGETYQYKKMGSGFQACFYDAFYNYVDGVLGESTSGSFTVPSGKGIRYVRVTILLEFIDEGMIYVGDGPGEYLPGTCLGHRMADGLYRPLMVGQHGDSLYSSVTDAVNDAADGDIIFVRNGYYDGETVRGWGKDLSIIGENPRKTVITNDFNSYERPPMEFSVGLLENLTIYARDTGKVSETHKWTSYGLHVEDNNLNGDELLVRNCIIRSDRNAGIGIGLRTGSHITFENCRFESRDVYAAFFHDANQEAGRGPDQNITFKGCVFVSHGSCTVLRVDSMRYTGNMAYVEMIDNVFQSDAGDPLVEAINSDAGGNEGTTGTFMGLVNFYKTNTSCKNNIGSLNSI